VEPSKRRWNVFDQLITPPQKHFGSLSLASIQKSVVQTSRRSGVLIEPLEPDDSDEECVAQSFIYERERACARFI
jgi:hypothetical protein